MPILLLIRHGENDYVKAHKLPGRLPGIHLNERGRKQATALAESLRSLPLAAIYASPLERASETAQPLADVHGLEVQIHPDLTDTDVGAWAGRSWKVLRRTKAWKVIQQAPSQFRFPEGESFVECQRRVVSALEEIARRHPQEAFVAVVFHADPIKLALAHFLGMPLDAFQRLQIAPGSVTPLLLTGQGGFLLASNLLPPLDLQVYLPPPSALPGRKEK